MTTTVTPEPALWQSRDGLTPADFAALYRQAAEIIRARGYDRYDEYEHASGVSIGTALALAAAAHVTDPRDAADLTEELETRLAGVLYVTGQAYCRTGIRDLSDTVASWERASVRVYASTKYRSRTEAEAAAVLEAAAAMLAAIPVDGAR